jgi:putative phosphoesterase
MKLAVLADIHANFVALQTVTAHLEAWQPDLVIVAGDVVNRGPRPRECWQLVENKQRCAGWLLVRGNHEDYVLSHTRPTAPRQGPEFEIQRHAYWTYQQLNGSLPRLANMPEQQILLGPDGREIRVTHGSRQGRRDGIYPETTTAELRRKIEPSAALFCVGHTHRPLVRQIDHTLVVNVGSAGLPFDGDPRPSYAQLQWCNGRWQANIIRLVYDQAQAERDFFETGCLEQSGPLVYLILDELRTAQSRLFQWTELYQAPVLAGQLSLEESAREFLIALGRKASPKQNFG